MYRHTNRKGVTYHLHCTVGRGGARRYTMRRSPDGAQVELPRGYEVVENVNGQVSVRTARPRVIPVEEETAVRSGLERFGLDRYRLEVNDACITVFEPDRDAAAIAAEFDPLTTLPAGIGKQLEAMIREQRGDAEMNRYLSEHRRALREQLEATTRYAPVLRFELADPKRRTFRIS